MNEDGGDRGRVGGGDGGDDEGMRGRDKIWKVKRWKYEREQGDGRDWLGLAWLVLVAGPTGVVDLPFPPSLTPSFMGCWCIDANSLKSSLSAYHSAYIAHEFLPGMLSFCAVSLFKAPEMF